MSRSQSPAFQDLPPVWAPGDDGAGRRTPSLSGRRTIGPGGFGKQAGELPGSRSQTPLPPSESRRADSRQDNGRRSDSKLDFYLPFKLFKGRKDAPAMFDRGVVDYGDYEPQDGPKEIGQMESFISETAQMMVAPHALKCTPFDEGVKEDLFKMESLGDLMKKHKDAFQEEYSEFGPASVWAPDPPNANSMPIPPAARKLGKFFDLRGELSTINHVRRARCRIRSPPPVLLGRLPTPAVGLPLRSATSLGFEPTQGDLGLPRKKSMNKAIDILEYSPPATIRQQFPNTLQALYLPPARNDISIAEDLRMNVQDDAK